MAGQLDEISRLIGGLEEATRTLQTTFRQHCADDDRRHAENIEALRENNNQIAELNRILGPLAKTVKGMVPTFANDQISRWKRAGAWSFALALMGFVAWLVQLSAGALIGYLHSLK